MTNNGKRYLSGAFATIFVTVVIVMMYSSCGDDEFNVYQPVAEPFALKSDDKAKLEQARVYLDKKEYDKALEILNKLVEDPSHDSNEARILYAAAKLGQSQLDVWTVVKNILDSQTSSSSGSKKTEGGIDGIFDSFSDSVLGSGEERTAKIEALSDSLTMLLAAPNPTEHKLQNTACIFAGFLAVPTLANATTAVEGVQTALQQIRDAATGGGSECPNISLLDSAAAEVVSVSGNFNLVLQAAQSCPFLDLDEASNLMNSVETSMNTLKTAADKGCDSVPSNCPSSLPNCTSLFPTCVQEALQVGTSSAVSGDGEIATCEVVLNCIDPASCFQ